MVKASGEWTGPSALIDQKRFYVDDVAGILAGIQAILARGRAVEADRDGETEATRTPGARS